MSARMLEAWRSFPETLDAAVECWHNGMGEGLELHEFLGLTWPEYRELTGPGSASR